ncbi:MAG: MFS transporter [Pseudomonadota bacterium]
MSDGADPTSRDESNSLSHATTGEASPNNQTSPGRRKFAIAVLLTGVVFMGMGQTVVFAVLPPLARQMGLQDIQVLSIFMASAVFWVTMGPFWGRKSDTTGRKPMIITGYTAFGISMILFASVARLGLNGVLTGLPLFTALILSRIIYGMIGSASPGASTAYIADRTSPEDRTAGVAAFPAAFGLGAMAGPLVATAFTPLGPVAPIYAVAILALGAAGTVFFLLPERTPPKDRPRPPRVSPTDTRVRAFLLFGIATSIATAIPVQFVAFYVIDRIAPADTLTATSTALSAAAAASLFAQLAIIQRLKPSPGLLMRIGPGLIFIAHVTIAGASSMPLMIVGMVFSGLGAGLITPGYVGGASLAVSKEEQGAVAGLSNAAMASGFIFAPILGTLAYQIAPQAVFVLTATIAFGALVFAFLNPTMANAIQLGRRPT